MVLMQMQMSKTEKQEWKFVGFLKDYCANCTLAGFSYIANRNLHLVERIFWLICVALSAVGSYLLISQYQRDFNSRAVSIVYESLPSTHKILFPTVAVCDMYNKFVAAEELIEFVTSLNTRGDGNYNYDVETFITFLVYPYFYREDNIKGWCTIECDDGCAKCPETNLRSLYEKPFFLMIRHSLNTRGDGNYNYDVETFITFLVYPYFYREDNIKGWCTNECDDGCAKCPETNLRSLYEKFMTNCSEFFVSCEFSLKPIDCCDYFLPLTTPHGNCFMFNSLLNNKRGSPSWYNNEIDPMTDTAKMKIVTKKPTQLSILNEEDVPHNSLAGYKIEANKPGQDKTFQIFMQTMSNDLDVREISPEYRQCRFPDELLDDTAYKAYSFSTCFVDCLRVHQMKECNCSGYNFIPEPNSEYPDCDLKGLHCLEKFTLVRPDARNLLPWADSKYSCECLPSCTESDFKIVFDHQEPVKNSNPYMTISVNMPEFATERYRRQALRTRLDVVVSIGGILGLFLGASILSGIEFIYYFTLRLLNNYQMARNDQKL